VKTNRLLIALLVGTSLLGSQVGCKGPQGEVGPAGTTGTTGPAGPVGSPNVIYSAWAGSTWTQGSYFSATGRYYDMVAPKVTQAVLDQAVIITYWKPAGSTSQVVALPTRTADGAKWEWYPVYTVGQVRVWVVNDARTDIGASNIGTTNQFRYVIIPGGVGARKAALDYTDYEAVKRAFNLPD
jgi:hypothetical protein